MKKLKKILIVLLALTIALFICGLFVHYIPAVVHFTSLHLPVNELNSTYLHEVSLIFLTAALVVATGAIFYTAWYQLDALKERSKAEFLLHIDKRYGSKEMLETRELISKLLFKKGYFEATSGEHKTSIIKTVAGEIYDKRQKDPDRKDSTHLMDLLDFLETIAYFKKKNYISKRDIDEIFGKAFIQYHELFSVLLEKEFNRDKENKSYRLFPKLVEKMKQREK